jgi:O-methyltransferase
VVVQTIPRSSFLNFINFARKIKNQFIRRGKPPSLQLQEWASRGAASYDANNLVTWHQSVDFMADQRFLSAYRRGMDSGHQIMRPPGSNRDIHIEWRVAIACWAASHATRIPGDFVECGVNTGIVSLAVCEYTKFNSISKSFWLFDTFNGIPLEQASELELGLGREKENIDMYFECYEKTKSNFESFHNVNFVKGRVPETLNLVSISEVAFLHLDMNIAYPERAAIEFFWPKMPVGAVVLLDDYGWAPYRPQKDTLDEFAIKNGVEIMMLPTGQGLLIKS